MKQLEEIKARASAATPGPWVYDRVSGVETIPEFDLHRFDIMPETVARIDLRHEDGEFIAATRTEVPKLVAALEAVEEVLEWLDAVEEIHPANLNASAAGVATVIRKTITEAMEAE
jgi:hypothetical protein